MDRLDCTLEDIPDFEHLSVKTLHQPVPKGAGTHYSRRNVIVEEVRADQLKGVGRGYTLYHVFGITSLHVNAFRPMPMLRDLMKPTRAFLAEHGFYAIEKKKLQP